VPEPRGRVPTLFENDTLKAWWVAGAWPQLAPAIYSIVLQRLPRKLDLDTREDFAQRAAIRCWQSRTIPDSPISFITVVAYNMAKDHYKSKRVRTHVPWDDTHDLAEDLIPDALAQILADRPETRLRDALRQLPTHLQRPLILQVYHRRSSAALAVQFGTTDGAMKMRLSRARKELRRAYLGETNAVPVPEPVAVLSPQMPVISDNAPRYLASVREVLARCYP